MDAGSPLRRPIPVARSILWAPPLGGGVRPAEIPFPIFLSQVALTAISEHVATPLRAGQGVLGFLLGDLCECPETNVSYLVIDAALRLNQAIHGDRSRDVVTRLWDKIEAQLAEQQAHLIGWYHTHAPRPPHAPAPSQPPSAPTTARRDERISGLQDLTPAEALAQPTPPPVDHPSHASSSGTRTPRSSRAAQVPDSEPELEPQAEPEPES